MSGLATVVRCPRCWRFELTASCDQCKGVGFVPEVVTRSGPEALLRRAMAAAIKSDRLWFDCHDHDSEDVWFVEDPGDGTCRLVRWGAGHSDEEVFAGTLDEVLSEAERIGVLG